MFSYPGDMPVRFTILGSGSNGNCAYLETETTRVLIDAGFSGRQIRQRMASIGRSPEDLDGILVTHEHGDHIRGLSMIAGKLGLPVYCNRLTKEAVDESVKGALKGKIFATGSHFEVGDLGVETFSLPHDAQDPVGFLIHAPGVRVGILTDLGHATKLVTERIKTANVLVLETNHDVKMLQEDTKRPWSLKQRVMSRHGHLSNEAAANFMEGVISANLHHLFLGHLSQECNRPDLAQEVVGGRLEGIGAGHVQVRATSQREPTETLVVGE